MQDQRGFRHFLKRSPERLDQRGRELAEESDGIGQERQSLGRQPEFAQRWIERSEHLGVREDVRARQPVEQGGFAGVGVAAKSDGRKRYGSALGPLQAPRRTYSLEVGAQLDDASAYFPAVALELRLARTAGADAAAQAGHLGTASGQPGQEIVELSQFHLQPALPGPRMLGEDIQYQLRAVEDGPLQRPFQVAMLRCRQIVVEQDEVATFFGGPRLDLEEFAGSEQRRRRRTLLRLQDLADHLGPGASSQFSQLVQRLLGGERFVGSAARRPGAHVERGQDAALGRSGWRVWR